MLELDFSQTLGTHCLQIRETLPTSGITAVFGVSGAGKTSLINAISGLTRPQQGRIVLNGRVLNDVEKRICLAPSLKEELAGIARCLAAAQVGPQREERRIRRIHVNSLKSGVVSKRVGEVLFRPRWHADELTKS